MTGSRIGTQRWPLAWSLSTKAFMRGCGKRLPRVKSWSSSCYVFFLLEKKSKVEQREKK